MESIKDTLADMMGLFNSRMARFEEELHKTVPVPPSMVSLADEFAVFKTFIVEALQSLQQQVELLARETDQLEMRGRRKILLLHGVPENKQEDTAAVAAALVVDKLCVAGFEATGISRCHRMGHSNNKKPRPILLKFRDVCVRDQVWFSKTRLKGSGITLSEFLTRRRHIAFMAARKQFGVNKCWTRDGYVHVVTSNGSRHRIIDVAELSTIANTETPTDKPAGKPANPQRSQKPATERPVRSGRRL